MNVFYFGGYLSTHDDVVSWKNSFEKKTSGRTATVFHYPEGASAGDPLEVWDASEAVAKEVQDGDMIVGHSSGCAIANDVATKALKLGKKFSLFALDGFCPSRELLALPTTQVWSARNGNICSLNYNGLINLAGHNFRTWGGGHVTKRWPLHFSLVNLNVSDHYADITQGYHNCDANIHVLGFDSVYKI